MPPPPPSSPSPSSPLYPETETTDSTKKKQKLELAALTERSQHYLMNAVVPLIGGGLQLESVRTSELNAFINYAFAFPDNFTALLDTFSVEK